MLIYIIELFKLIYFYIIYFHSTNWFNLDLIWTINAHLTSALLEKKLSRQNITIGSGTKAGCRSIQFGPRLDCIQRTRVQIRVESKVHYQFYRGTFCIPGVKDSETHRKRTSFSPLMKKVEARIAGHPRNFIIQSTSFSWNCCCNSLGQRWIMTII